MQRLAPGPLIGVREVWLDGGHNQACAEAIAAHFTTDGRKIQLICGILANKDAHGLLGALAGVADRIIAVPVPGHPCHPPEELAAIGRSLGMETSTAANLPEAIAQTTSDPVLILGSLYLAGEALKANGQVPD